MNRQESVLLVRYVKGLCPTQPLDEFTPDSWADPELLGRYSLDDCKKAALAVYRDKGSDAEFGGRRVEGDDIAREVKRMRADRLAQCPPEALIPPPGLTVLEDVQWRRDALRRVADGEVLPTDTRGELKPRGDLKVLAGRRIEDA